MTTHRSYAGYVVAENRDSKFRLSWPVRADHVVLVFLSILILMWAFGEAQVYSALTTGRLPAGVKITLFGVESRESKDPYFMVYALAIWTVAGTVMIGFFLCATAGKEIIEIDAVRLTRRKSMLGLSRSKEYKVADIRELRPAPYIPPASRSQPYPQPYPLHFPLSFQNGGICFDYSRDTHFLGSGLDEGESRYVIDEMCKRVTSLRPPDTFD